MRHVPDAAEQARLRGYIIDALELAASFEDQSEYQANVPIAQVSAEVLLHWSDVYHPEAPDYYSGPAYSTAEVEAMKTFHVVWESVCDSTPKTLPGIEEAQTWPQWERLRDAARDALLAFAVRGRSPELT